MVHPAQLGALAVDPDGARRTCGPKAATAAGRFLVWFDERQIPAQDSCEADFVASLRALQRAT